MYVYFIWAFGILSVCFFIYGRVKSARGELSAVTEMLSAIWCLLMALVFTFAYIGHALP